MPATLFKKQEKTPAKNSNKFFENGYSGAEIKSGLLIFLSFCTLGGLLFMTGNFQTFQETYTAKINFNYISGLQKNAPVHFAGHEVGKVTEIQLVGSDAGQVTVTISLAKSAVLKKDSRVFIDIMGFMGEKFVEITPGSKNAEPLQPGDTLQGTDPIALNEIMEKGTAIADELQKTTVSLRGLIQDMDGMLDTNSGQIQKIFYNLDYSSENLKDMTVDLKYHPWKILRKGKEKKPEEIIKKELTHHPELAAKS